MDDPLCDGSVYHRATKRGLDHKLLILDYGYVCGFQIVIWYSGLQTHMRLKFYLYDHSWNLWCVYPSDVACVWVYRMSMGVKASLTLGREEMPWVKGLVGLNIEVERFSSLESPPSPIVSWFQWWIIVLSLGREFMFCYDMLYSLLVLECNLFEPCFPN